MTPPPGNLYAQTSPATEDAIKELEKSLEGARIDPVLKVPLVHRKKEAENGVVSVAADGS
eukprot:754642-Hanusia_phi.AAC.1